MITDDLILSNVRIFPETSEKSIHIKKDRIYSIHDDNINYNSRIAKINLSGKTIIPAFTDAHTHFMQWALSKIGPNLFNSESYETALDIIDNYINNNKDISVVIASDYDENIWKEQKIPDKKDLDKISTEIPIIMRRICGHLAVGNSKAIENILSKKYENFIETKSGIMKEDPALYIYRIFPPDELMYIKAFHFAQKTCHEMGISSIGEITLREMRKFIRAFDLKKELSLRFRCSVLEEEYFNSSGQEIFSIEDENFFSLRAIKVFLDGSIGGRTASVNFKWKDSDSPGMLLKSSKELNKILEHTARKNKHIWIHAIGNNAISTALSVIKDTVDKDYRNIIRIEHFELPDISDISLAADLGIFCSMQPNFIRMWSGKNGLYQKVLPEDVYLFNNPIKALEIEGCKIAFGSDNMPPGPLWGIKGAVKAPFKSQKISLENAFRYYTEYASLSLGDDDIGKIEPGYKADIAVLSTFPEEDNLDDVKVVKLFIEGKEVFNEKNSVI